MKKSRPLRRLAAAAIVALAAGSITAHAYQGYRGHPYDSPDVSFSPDGTAWTTNAGEKDAKFYTYGDEVSTGMAPTVKQVLDEGEHYYIVDVDDGRPVPIEKWTCRYQYGTCMHTFDDFDTHAYGYDLPSMNCLGHYHSGWIATCADCGKMIDMLVYMRADTAAQIGWFPTDKEYHFLCPHCGSMEQGAPVAHRCNEVSPNQYKVVYDANTDGAAYRGYVPVSVHMWNNAAVYDGEAVVPVRNLNKNSFLRAGYDFLGWNTEPDGSGQSFSDGSEIYNLCSKDWRWDGPSGIVRLYAQWGVSMSSLDIDPNGGTYGGSKSVTRVTQSFGSSFDIQSRTLVPPDGALVQFVTNGAPSIPDVRQSQHLSEWSQVAPFGSKFDGRIYEFLEKNGHADTIRAVYGRDGVILPEPKWANHSFSGWYYDAAFTLPAGAPGDAIVPVQDTVLYAQWAELTLYSKDDYSAYGGSGAVDLSWVQADTNQKSYKLFQSRDRANWNRISAADDIGAAKTVSVDWAYSGAQQSYTVPYTGLYDLTAYGAQGGGHGTYAGGLGGQSYGRFWLRAGEVLTVNTGGQNGYNGGGAASAGGFSCGRGMSSIASSTQGTLLIAGGGGGASPTGNGGAGGSQSSLRPDGAQSGQDGMAGGGGGHTGGLSGEYLMHSHADSCFVENSGSSDVREEFFGKSVITNGSNQINISVGSASDYYETPYEGHVTIDVGFPWTNNSGDGNMIWGDYNGNIWDTSIIYSLCLIGEDGSRRTVSVDINKDFGPGSHSTAIMEKSLSGWREPARATYHRYTYSGNQEADAWFDGTIYKMDRQVSFCDGESYTFNGLFNIDGKVSFDIPKGTKGIYLHAQLRYTYEGGVLHPRLPLSHMVYTYEEKMKTCPYEEGDIESSKPAYGGSSYVSPYARASSQTPGARTGDGLVQLRSVSVGFSEEMHLNDVRATDLAAPDMVDRSKVSAEALGARETAVSWEAPKDNGTAYYHKAESYLTGSDNRLCESNVTKNVLTSGIAGYWCLVDASPGTTVTAANGAWHADGSAAVGFDRDGQVRYLHVAAADVAGNVSGTLHLKLTTGDGGDIPLYWPVRTLQMDASGDYIWPDGDRRWFVKADGESVVRLTSRGYIDGDARDDYQVDMSVFEMVLDGRASQDTWQVPLAPVSSDRHFAADSLGHGQDSGLPLQSTGSAESWRVTGGKHLNTAAEFTVPPPLHGKSILVLPRAGATVDKWSRNISDRAEDLLHGVTLIADGNGPTYHGTGPLEELKDGDLIDRRDGEIELDITATDDLSGVRGFAVTIANTDNFVTQTYEPDGDGHVRITITEDDYIFSGDFTVSIAGTDNVGNASSVSFGVTEFDLEASIERMLAPHDPAFKAGESGVLHISTWGYADYVTVEFPSGFTALDPELDTSFIYKGNGPQSYKEDEAYQFMVPLYAPEGTDFRVKVTAWKDGKKIEKYPSFGVYSVDGTVLEEIRDRLR